MHNSWILAGVTLGAFLLFAAGGWWVARRMKDRRQRRTTHLKVGFLVVMGVSLAAFAFWTDSQQRRTTLYEVILDGTSAKDAILQVEFNVEHASVEHDLLIGPMFRPPHWNEPTTKSALRSHSHKQTARSYFPTSTPSNLALKTPPGKPNTCTSPHKQPANTS
ncbi:MAG: hypothetical protein R3B91_17340 [Planctomycetaceae bacterium]